MYLSVRKSQYEYIHETLCCGHGILLLTHFPARGIMSLSQWSAHWLNDNMPCAGKRVLLTLTLSYTWHCSKCVTSV